MKKKSKNLKTKLLFIALASSLLHGQITYTSSDYASTGSSFNTAAASITSAIAQNFVQTGADFSWNYSGLTADTTGTQSFVDPASLSYKNIWCLYHLYLFNCNSQFNSNFSLAQPLPADFSFGEYAVSDGYSFQWKDAAKLQTKMFAGQVTLSGTTVPLFVEYTQPDVVYQFPITYGSSYSNPLSVSMDFSSLGYDFQISSTGTRINTVEGWGNLTIPNHTFSSVLKVKSVQSQSITITYEGNTYTQNLETVTYDWFSKDYGIPVLSVSGSEATGTYVPVYVQYLDFGSLATPETQYSAFLIYPNPVKDVLKTNIDEHKIKSVTIYSLEGKIAGKSLNVSMLPKGNYILRIETTEGKILREKFIKE